MSKVNRFDSGSMERSKITREGFLRFNSIVTRTGVFTYLNGDGSLRKELRHPDDVLKADSLESLKMIPITLLHPPGKVVVADNAKELSVGFTGENVSPDGKFIKLSGQVTVQSAIDNVENGMKELSLGYETEVIEEVGEYDGIQYDHRQTQIEYNHLAIVPSARAGKEASIKLNHADAMQVITEKKPPKQKENIMDDKLVSVNLDGIAYKASPEVQNAFNKEKTRADTFEASVKTITGERDTLQGKLDASQAELEKAKNVNLDELIHAGVKERISLLEIAKTHIDAETLKTIDSMSNKDIKIAACKGQFTNLDFADKSEEYVNAIFDTLSTEKKNDNSIGGQRQQMNQHNTNTDSNEDNSADAAKERMIKARQDASNPKE